MSEIVKLYECPNSTDGSYSFVEMMGGKRVRFYHMSTSTVILGLVTGSVTSLVKERMYLRPMYKNSEFEFIPAPSAGAPSVRLPRPSFLVRALVAAKRFVLALFGFFPESHEPVTLTLADLLYIQSKGLGIDMSYLLAQKRSPLTELWDVESVFIGEDIADENRRAVIDNFEQNKPTVNKVAGKVREALRSPSEI